MSSLRKRIEELERSARSAPQARDIFLAWDDGTTAEWEVAEAYAAGKVVFHAHCYAPGKAVLVADDGHSALKCSDIDVDTGVITDCPKPEGWVRPNYVRKGPISNGANDRHDWPSLRSAEIGEPEHVL
jgi:hypothetical protein